MVQWCVICQKMHLMLTNWYAKYIGGIGKDKKIRRCMGVVLTPSLSTGGLYLRQNDTTDITKIPLQD